MEKIEINISPKGEISYKVDGVKGPTCKDLTKFIDKLGKVTQDKNTPEYCELPQQNQVQEGL